MEKPYLPAAVSPSEPVEAQSQVVIPFKKNWEALAELQQENERLAAGWVISSLTAATYLIAPLAPPGGAATAAAGLMVGAWTSWRSTKVVRLLQTGKALLQRFESQGIEIYPRIPVDGMNPIDLFVRFPKKTHLFISIRSKGDREVVYNEEREVLQLKKRGKPGLSLWEPNPLVELADYKSWFDKNRGLFGMSSKEAIKTPAAKVLSLWHPTTAETHRDHLYTEMGDLKLLVLRRKGSTFVIQEEELINFIQAWLDKYN
ncbi:MAG: hypothetical protein HC895_16110 [Leptolyngbyaceae cyanobacterium SM1_3_5]|nr:hypothetical protein [Leptolyngbyaceae cyanobacterium SM1_3_5]